ncbi:MAG TPA: GntG family PLP-dependent aldolase [Candidatus Limnocylindria bacterium]|nr:GntG family PLP-dependent aldolase [Candidatus Limnocylindria bacterium]
MPHRVDLRSDTVTRPSPAMRRAMAEAEVGDDQYGEDPSVNRLQAEVAELLGKEAALFLPSGTMANQVALRTLTRPGDDVLVPTDAHVVLHETGGAAANAGVQFTLVGHGGTFTPADVEAAIKPHRHIVYPPTTLLVVENTHNRAGGIVFPQADAEAAAALAREHGVATYLDGARLLNAAAASGPAASELAAPFDLVSLSLSKGLGCPVGSLLAGRREVVGRAHRYRRMLGGAMRQAGILAAAGSWALRHNVARLVEDHAAARLLAERLAECPTVRIDLATVQTNIIVFWVADAPAFVAACRERGVLLNAFSPTLVRAVTHLDVDRAAVEHAARVLTDVASRVA